MVPYRNTALFSSKKVFGHLLSSEEKPSLQFLPHGRNHSRDQEERTRHAENRERIKAPAKHWSTEAQTLEELHQYGQPAQENEKTSEDKESSSPYILEQTDHGSAEEAAGQGHWECKTQEPVASCFHTDIQQVQRRHSIIDRNKDLSPRRPEPSRKNSNHIEQNNPENDKTAPLQFSVQPEAYDDRHDDRNDAEYCHGNRTGQIRFPVMLWQIIRELLL